MKTIQSIIILSLIFIASGASAQETTSLPASSIISMTIDRPLNSASVQPGTQFGGVTDFDVISGNDIAIPKGTEVIGRVLSATSSGRAAGKADIVLELTKVKKGNSYIDLPTHPVIIAASEGKGRSTARNVAVGAAVGAAFNKGKGAGRGAATMGAISILGDDGNITLPKGYNIQFTSSTPFNY